MSSKEHPYSVSLRWTGNLGSGTQKYDAYSRNFEVSVANKDVISGSSDPIFRGDSSAYNPEEMLVMALSSCHMLWYLHLCADEGISVISYEDHAIGLLRLEDNGSGRFRRVTLRPEVSVRGTEADVSRALKLHAKTAEMCFITNSVNFEVFHDPTVIRNLTAIP